MTEKKTILIVDDTPDNISLISALLKNTYKIKIATNGAKAIDIAFSASPPDLILLDIMMPEIDGYEVCRRLKADERTQAIPVIFLTAMSQVENEQKGLELGAVDYITKPISPPILTARVNTHLRLKEANDYLKQENDILEQKVQKRTQELSQLNQSLARFVPEEFLKALGRSNILDVHLGDNTFGAMTVLFADIRSYTTLAETMSPQETFGFLNAYLGRIGPVIRENHGFVSHFLGDGIIAIFPVTREDAIRAAISMQQKVAAYNQHRQSKGRIPIKIGIGLNSGPLMMGIIGDGRRTDASVVADTVNTASRMEGLTKYYGVSIVVSETTFAGINDLSQYHYRLLDKVQVKGKKQVTTIYEMFDADPDELRERKAVAKLMFERGQQYYFIREFAEALKCFTDVLTALPEDLTTKHYLERSARFLLEGVPDDWQGIRIMDGK
jgi:CheY-like chemotaxis protein/class 3 adenylate cyclase